MKNLVLTLWHDPAAARKFIVALLGIVVAAATQGLIPDPYAAWVAVTGATLVAGGVWGIPNKPVRLPKHAKRG